MQPNMALLSLACRFPDADSSAELWANVLEGRRSFRELPPERLDLTQYRANVLGESDSISPIRAGLLTNWSFNRARYKIPKVTFESTDLTHWLALELAAEAINSIGGVERLNRARTAVVVANTLTGEFSRASLLRLRAPFLDDLLARAAESEGLTPDASKCLRRSFTLELRRHFPDPNEDSLAGGLANTIAGRIANHFDLNGGAYTVDAACASSLVAVADAATLLATDQVDAVVVGAVDLSIDPFELVGFSRNGALATDEMRVFDARSNGFWPGEGGAFAVLMRDDDARRAELPRVAIVRGWGLSTDGAGGLTRPSSTGQLTAYRRAYEGARVDPTDLAFVEAHGTGTAVGDPIEIRALATLRDGAKCSLPVGSIKANIGHTKAAAGFAGLIKAVESLRRGIVPPHVGCSMPHQVFAEVDHRLRPPVVPERLKSKTPLAGVSSFGFGGVNAHIVLERAGARTPLRVTSRTPKAHDAELFLFAGATADEVLRQVETLEHRALSLSMSELTDAAADVARKSGRGPIRVAVVAPHGGKLIDCLARAKSAVSAGEHVSAMEAGIFVGQATRVPRIGFVFPGQAAPSRPGGGLWSRCFSKATELTRSLPFYADTDSVATEIAQPAIMAASLTGLTVLGQLGVRAVVGVGHSLGEIAALAWGGALTADDALEFARMRGEIMAREARAGGAMLRVALSAVEAEPIASAAGAVIACENGPTETVFAGRRAAIEGIAALLESRRIETTRMSVSHAFHSPDMAAAVPALRTLLSDIAWRPCTGTIVSTVTGSVIEGQNALSELLARQITVRVLFDAAMEEAMRRADLFVEVGPGHGLTRLVRGRGAAALSIDAFGSSLAPLLSTLGELHVRGCDLQIEDLFADRPVRPFELSKPAFIESPCGRRSPSPAVVEVALPPPHKAHEPIVVPTDDRLATILAVVAAQTGLPEGSFGPDDRFLDTLHLNSLSVTRIVAVAARSLGVRGPSAPTEFANATPRILLDALQELGELDDEGSHSARVAGVRPWVATYAVRWIPAAPWPAQIDPIEWSTVTIGGPGEEVASCTGQSGRLIRLSAPFTRPVAEALITIAAEAARNGVPHFMIVHNDAPVSGFARSLAREGSFRTVRVVGGVRESTALTDLALVLDRNVGRYSESRLGLGGALETPVFAPTHPAHDPIAAITADDVAVVVGGGRGIVAECALRLGRSGATLILVGRSPPDTPAVAETLARASKAGTRCMYVCVDASDGPRLTAALAPSIDVFGPPTLLVHAAAVNEPMLISAVDSHTALRSLVPKMDAFANAIASCGPALRRIITFGSLIGRIGLEGEAHYALANAAQSAATEAWARAKSGRSALALEWSVWGGLGMGERLGTIERLASSGVDAISVDDALDAFDRLVQCCACGTVTVTSRFGPPPDLDLGKPELPSLRFLDRPLVHFPNKEIVLETTLSRGRDRYLDDHIVNGSRIFPGVMALEAMAQAVSCLSVFGAVTVLEDVVFERVVSLDTTGVTQLRIACLLSESGVDAAIFACDDGFAVPAIRARFAPSNRVEIASELHQPLQAQVSSFQADRLYGPLLFNAGSFSRLDHFAVATSRQVIASLSSRTNSRWFGSYEPSKLLLWDPGATDACLHALQVTVPHRRVLPVSVTRIEVVAGGKPAHVRAVEREARDGNYVFDITVDDAEGRCVQRWHRATFRAVGDVDAMAALSCEPALAVPYLERAAREAFNDDSIAVALVRDRQSARETRRRTALALLDLESSVDRRVDGAPVKGDGTGSISISHCEGITLAVAAKGRIGCDIVASDGGAFGRRLGALEACRKLGRRVVFDATGDLPCGRAVHIDGITLLTLDLPDSSGMLTVALSGLANGGTL